MNSGIPALLPRDTPRFSERAAPDNLCLCKSQPAKKTSAHSSIKVYITYANRREDYKRQHQIYMRSRLQLWPSTNTILFFSIPRRVSKSICVHRNHHINYKSQFTGTKGYTNPHNRSGQQNCHYHNHNDFQNQGNALDVISSAPCNILLSVMFQIRENIP